MKTCTWQEPDDYCMSLVEGRTEFCARHNRMMRKAEQTAAKDANNLAIKLLKSKLQRAEPRKKINKVSAKMKVKNQEYSERVKVWKVENPKCKANCNQYCTKETDDCHHQIGRGIHLMDEKYWLACCRNCHIFITNHPKEAMEKGWSFSRLEEREPHAI